MIDKNDLNYLAQIVIESLLEREIYSEDYIQGKAVTLAKHDNRYDTLLWCAMSLDAENTACLAKKFGVSVEDLTTTFKTIRKIENC